MMESDFEKYIGAEIERIYHIPDGRGGFRSVVFCFKGGDGLRIEPHHNNSLNPSVKLTGTTWNIVKAEKPKDETDGDSMAGFTEHGGLC